jgi:prefoldin subunit 5
MANDQSVDIVIQAIDEATATIRKVQGEVDNLKNRIETVSKQTEKATASINGGF